MAASAAVKARLKALRKKFGLGEFKGNSSAPKRARRRTESMAKKRASRRGGSKGSFIKTLAFGLLGAFLVRRVWNNQFSAPVGGAAAVAVLEGSRNPMKVGTGAVIGFLEPMVENAVAGVTGAQSGSSAYPF